MKIRLADYKFFPYEIDFLKKEVKTIGGDFKAINDKGKIFEIGNVELEAVRNLTYIRGFWVNDKFYESNQYLRESFNGNRKIQSRRYGPHGLHEYKGRYNPQLPRSLLLANFEKGQKIVDPFMGSGTTLIEARDLGIEAVGIELNPFAYQITKAKIFYEEVSELPDIIFKKKITRFFSPEQSAYLLEWFPRKQFLDLENILFRVESLHEKEKLKVKR